MWNEYYESWYAGAPEQTSRGISMKSTGRFRASRL